MIISISDKLTLEKSEKYNMSIRLQPGGLSFSVYNPASVDSYFYRQVDFDPAMDYLQELQSFFFENPFLAWPYKRITITQVTALYTLVPAELYEDKWKKEILSYNLSSIDWHPLSAPLKKDKAVLVYGMDEKIYEFCVRSFINSVFYHHLVPLLSIWHDQSRAGSQQTMFVVLYPGMADVVCYDKGKLLFVNSFEYDHVSNLLYYILYIWKNNEFDQLKDKLHITGQGETRKELILLLKNYLNQVEPMEIPTDAYLLGGNILQAPLDLIALSLCV